MQLFQRHYSELVEKNSKNTITIKYPIEDQLILKMPQLHGQVYQQKPKATLITSSSKEFENLLFIWEFCNNFDEFLEIRKFKIEELRLAIRWGSAPDDDMDDVFDVQKMTDKF
jgi:hypothetical protein